MTPARWSIALILLAACGGATGSAGDRATAPLEPTVRDSARVTIYEHPADALERAPLITIDSTPLAVFAGDVDDPSKDVSALMWPIFLGSGDLIGFDRQEYQILLLRVADESRVRYGRRGAGPGELGFPSPLYLLPGDSLLFNDNSNDRITIVHPDSGIVRTIARSSAAGLGRSSTLGRVGDSLYLLSVPGGEPAGLPSLGRTSFPRHLGTWRVGQDSVHEQFSVPGPWRVAVEVGHGAVAMYGLLFAAEPTVGQWGDGFVVAPADRWFLEQWGVDGQLRASVRINSSATPVDDSLFERYVETDASEMAENFVKAGRTPNLDSIRASVRDRGHADNVAAYGRVHVTPNGTVWVTDYQMPGDTTWAATAIASDGRILGRITAQPGEPPIAWGDDRVAFRSEDDLGIATITIRALHLPH